MTPETETTRDDAMVMRGTVVDVHRGGFFDVDVVAGAFRRRVKARLCGKMATSRIRVGAGDVVQVEVNPYDPSRGRIVYRLSGTR